MANERKVVRRNSEKEMTNALKVLKRAGWEPMMDPKMDVDFFGKVSWVCVCFDVKGRKKTKQHPFESFYS
jgi:hypothetical protein